MELRKTLHPYHFDLCLDLQGLAKSAIVAFLSGAKEKYGYWEMREGSFLVSKGLVGAHKYDHVIERYLDTIRALGGRVDDLVFHCRILRQRRRPGVIAFCKTASKGLISPSFPVLAGMLKNGPLTIGAAF